MTYSDSHTITYENKSLALILRYYLRKICRIYTICVKSAKEIGRGKGLKVVSAGDGSDVLTSSL